MIKTLMGSIRDYMKVTVATPLLVLGEVLCEMLIPFITANLIDAIKDGATVAEMLPTAGFLVLIALTSLAFGAAAGVTCSHASCGFAKNLRHDLFYKIQTFSFANIDEFSSSSLVTRLTTDINNVQQAFMMIIRIAVRAPLVLIFAFTMAFIMGGSVAMVYLIIIPLLGFGLFFIIFKVRPIFSRVFHKYDALNESVEENVTGMRVVKSYVREDFEKEKFATAARDVQMDFTRAEKLLAFNNPMMNICVNGAFVVIIYLGSKLIITSQGTLFDVGQLSSIFTYGFQILMSLMQLSMIFVMVTMADESAHRITEVLAAEPTIADPAEPVLEVADGSIDFDHVSFKYSAHAKRQALDDIDLHIKSGETIGIIGGTGSAKSTLVNLIARLYDATEGTVRSRSYSLEIGKLFPDITVSGVACPLWAAIVEANEADSPGADYFVKKRIDQLMRTDPLIDTIVLGCTHYPLLMNSIVKNVPDGVRIVPQGHYVAESLSNYLERHRDIAANITQGGTCRYFTTESEDKFRENAQIFLHEKVSVSHVELD